MCIYIYICVCVRAYDENYDIWKFTMLHSCKLLGQYGFGVNRFVIDDQSPRNGVPQEPCIFSSRGVPQTSIHWTANSILKWSLKTMPK